MHTLSPAVLLHLCFALCAVLLGPVALWARKGSRTHRMFGYFWVGAMVGSAVSCLVIHGGGLPNIAGWSPIHLLSVGALVGISTSVWQVSRGHIAAHRKTMQRTYLGACVVAGLFTLTPSRFLGDLLWHQTLGWV